MCYHLSLVQNLAYLQNRFGAAFEEPGSYEPAYHRAAFSSPRHPVIADDDPGRIRLYEWGLIPRWVKTEDQADDIRKGTYNAKAETIFMKPSFRSSIKDRRCLVLADGFFEWQHVEGKKYPYHIRLKSREAFAIAGVWDEWKGGGAVKRTFSVVTTEASPLMARIHNTKKRMPVILRPQDERRWLEKGLSTEEVRSLLRPFDDGALEAYTVAPLSGAGKVIDGPGTIAPRQYHELGEAQRTLF
jgi:putative SOS response-associated peptidase YedK